MFIFFFILFFFNLADQRVEKATKNQVKFERLS